MSAKTPIPSTRRVRVVCPHNCYDTCSQIATVTNGVVTRIDGDPNHEHTDGRLCAKGYSYVDRLYSRDRLHHPMVQEPRGSGVWRRISWDEAMDRVARALISLRDRYGTLLPLCLYRGSGNLGALHTVPEALFGSMGPLTVGVNTLCWTGGMAATTYDFGAARNHDPGDLENARTVLLWGVNPAWTAPHQMSRLLAMKDQGARLILIDPIATATATLSDMYLPIRPGTDGALALGMARHLQETGQIDQAFVEQYTWGWEPFLRYLDAEVTVAWAAAETGLEEALIRQVADEYARNGPSTIWIGYGMQRYRNAGQAVRAINALAALTGQIGRRGTGVQYGQRETWVFRDAPYLEGRSANRTVSTGNLVESLKGLTDPPVRMIWITQANPIRQGPDSEALRRLLAGMEMVVVVDQFPTATSAAADLILPTTTYLEQVDLNVSYWHHDVALNERAVEPLFESRSELAIAWALSRAVNQLRPGFALFPTDGDERQWLERLWSHDAVQLFGLDGPWALTNGPRRARLPRVAWEDLRFATPSGRYEFWSERAQAAGAPAMPVYASPAAAPEGFPIRLLTPHRAESLNSQFPAQAPVAEIHPTLAERLGLATGEQAWLISPVGQLSLPVRLTRTVPPDCAVVCGGTEGEELSMINTLTSSCTTDMADAAGMRGTPYADTFINIQPAER